MRRSAELDASNSPIVERQERYKPLDRNCFRRAHFLGNRYFSLVRVPIRPLGWSDDDQLQSRRSRRVRVGQDV